MNLKIENLQKSYDKKQVLCGAEFTFEQGKIYGLIGRNGSGKTTFFNCLNRDIKADGGSCTVTGEGGERPLIPEDIGYIVSTPVVPEFLTAREFISFFIDINRKTIQDPKKPNEYLDTMRIKPEDRDRLLKDYSHGMKNKMQMLINFIAKPPVLLLDEPLTSFDVIVAEEIKQLLVSIKSEHIIIFSTHILELALDLCDEIIILNGGTFSEVRKDELERDDYKQLIISALREDDDV